VNDAAGRFSQRVIARQALMGIAAWLVLATFAPKLLVLDWEVTLGLLSVLALLTLLAFAASTAMAIFALRRHRFVIRAIGLGTTAIAPGDLADLADLPSSLTFRWFGVSSLCAALELVPGVRPAMLDDGRAVSLFILAITILSAAAIPSYVLIRRATIDLLELAPLDQMTMLLETLELKQIPRRRLTLRVLLAVAAPVALMGTGAALVTHAHLRTLTEQSRRATALLIARVSLEAGPGTGTPDLMGRGDAIAAAAGYGFVARIDTAAVETTETTMSREADGQLTVVTPLERGQAVIHFSADLTPEDTSIAVAVGLLAVLIAGALGGLFGRVLGDDLGLATRSLQLLGTESVLRGGGALLARPARFAVVESLGRAIEELTGRFRVFAAAQERALDMRAAAQRMRGLLFASVSHDLKSPLNAILGFAELVAQEPLTAAQRESLQLITRRGRELLALIETILDAARVEAEQLNLHVRLVDVRRLIGEALRKARELCGSPDTPIAVEIADDLPSVSADPAYATRALAVIIAHALRVAAADPSAKLVRLRAVAPPDVDDRSPRERVVIEVEYGSRELENGELERLFARQATGRGQGLTLGLSLARSVIELHGGSVDVAGSQDGAPVCRVSLPLTAPSWRPRLSSFPTLG
jgi:signal transduction histidine kinase